MISSIKNLLRKSTAPVEKPVAEAYDLWSGSYDHQPGNLMLDLDENIFTDLLSGIHLHHKIIADIGCGTGRHWQKLYEKNPALIIGFDLSAGMLQQLKQKFPGAFAQQTSNNRLEMV
jgi:ubiquinone/menaquinone biosynthesis C-methylase UbiE